MNILGALGYAFANLLHPRMLWLMVWPLLVALAVWGSVAALLWARLALLLADLIRRGLESAAFFTRFDFSDIALIAANVALFLLIVPLVYLTALVILSIFGMGEMVDHVAGRSFPSLERRHGGGVLGAGWNALAALIGMTMLCALTLPLWLFPPLWPVATLLIFAWTNQRLLRYDALADHADREEMRHIFRAHRGHLYVLGLLLALLAYVPVIGFVAPVLFGLAFIRYLLGALAQHRASLSAP